MSQLHPEPDYGETSYQGHERLAGQAALITEAESGVGRAVALAFAREGADLALSSLMRDSDIELTARLVTQAGRRAIVLCGDVRDEGYRVALARETLAGLGSLNIVVTNSGLDWAHQSFEHANSADMELELRTYNESVIFLTQTVADAMNDGGSIIHTTPMRFTHPPALQRAYATTAGAIGNYVVSHARELARRGIRLNAVTPGPVWSPRIVRMLPPETLQTFGREGLWGRPAQPAELAAIYVFLASGESNLVSGTVLHVGCAAG